MWYPATVTAAPTTEPVTLAEAKRHCRVSDFTDDDDYLQSLAEAALSHVESYCGAQFASREVSAQATDWCEFARLPVVPITAVTSISYVDTDGAAQTLATSVYELRGDAIVLKYGQSWPPTQTGSLITLTATGGFESCPAAVKHAMLLWISEAYNNRASAALADWTTMDSLLCNHRYYP